MVGGWLMMESLLIFPPFPQNQHLFYTLFQAMSWNFIYFFLATINCLPIYAVIKYIYIIYIIHKKQTPKTKNKKQT